MKKIKIRKQYILAFGVWLFAVFPYVFWGENAIITVHDNLDEAFAFIQMYKLNGFFWKIDVPTTAMNGTSTLYIHSNFSLYYLLMNYLPTFAAYIVNYAITIVLGTVTMYCLLKKIFKLKADDCLYMVIALTYALLPIYPPAGHTFAILPFYVILMIDAWNDEKINKRYLVCVVFPFLFSLFFFGVFMYVLWGMEFLVCLIKKKKLNINLLYGGILQVIGIALCDIRTICTLFQGVETNRVLQKGSEGVFCFVKSVVKYAALGQYHAQSEHIYIIVPTICFGLCYMFVKKKKITVGMRWDLVVLAVIGVLCILYGLYDTDFTRSGVSKALPFVVGFNWGRIGFANRLLWYILFAHILVELLEIYKKGLFVYALVIAQLLVVIGKPIYYNDTVKNYLHEYNINKGEVTYAEFFDTSLFEEIKKDIGYDGEKVVAFGFHPSVLIFNGFSTIDGYSSYYPLREYYEFKKIIMPELEVNKEARDIYERGGIRRYLYSAELGHRPTREKAILPVRLNVDINELKKWGGAIYYS